MLVAATYRKTIEHYYAVLDELAQKQVSHEQGLRPAMQNLLAAVGKKVGWTLVPEQRLPNGNDSLTLAAIPPAVFDYRLGNRSALEWVIDQYQLTTDKRSGITSDPNREDDPEYIVRLIGRVVTVSLETVKMVEGLPIFRVSDD